MKVVRETGGDEVELSTTPELPVDEGPPSDGEIPDLVEISTDAEQYDDGWRDSSDWDY